MCRLLKELMYTVDYLIIIVGTNQPNPDYRTFSLCLFQKFKYHKNRVRETARK